MTDAYADEKPRDDHLIALLTERDGQSTRLILRSGHQLVVFNIAWGYDAGDPIAHVTTNISPYIEGQPVDFFFTSEVVAVLGDDDRELMHPW